MRDLTNGFKKLGSLVAGGWAWAVMSWAGAVMSWAGTVKAVAC